MGNPVVAPPWVFVPNPEHNLCWLRCDMSVIEVICPECGAKLGEPCYYAEEVYKTLNIRTHRATAEYVPMVRPGRHKGASHKARQKAATARRNGRSKIGVPLTLEVDMASGKIKVNALIPNIIEGSREVAEEQRRLRLSLPATKGELEHLRTQLKERLDAVEEACDGAR